METGGGGRRLAPCSAKAARSTFSSDAPLKAGSPSLTPPAIVTPTSKTKALKTMVTPLAGGDGGNGGAPRGDRSELDEQALAGRGGKA